MNIILIIKKLINDKEFRLYSSSLISFIANILFLVYNLSIGLYYKLIWNLSVSLYFLILMIIKGLILFNERKWIKNKNENISLKRYKLFKIQSIFLLLIDISLIVPVIFLLYNQKIVNTGFIPTIAIAAYTTYKIIFACLNYSKTKKMNNLSLHGLKVITLKETIVSIITLQNTMIIVFGDGNILDFTIYTSIGLLLLMTFISIIQFIKIKKISF